MILVELDKRLQIMKEVCGIEKQRRPFEVETRMELGAPDRSGDTERYKVRHVPRIES